MSIDKKIFLVSVIIPVYNDEKYLCECVDSVIRQTYNNLEIILIDDGSRDKSGKICDEYAKVDDRIKVVHQNNHGVSFSRNKGIEISAGKYIAFIDADDSVEVEYLEEMVKCMHNIDCDLILSGYNNIFCDKNIIQSNYFNGNISGNIKNDFHKMRKYLFAPWGKLYKREIIIKNNILFPIDFSDAEDHVFNFEYISHIRNYFYINKSLYNYYHRNRKTLSKLVTAKSFYSNYKRLLKEKEFLNLNQINRKEYIFTNSCLDVMNKYCKISDIDDNYCLYSERVLKIKELLYGFKYYNNIKQKIALLLLKYNIIYPLYLWYSFKHYKRR